MLHDHTIERHGPHVSNVADWSPTEVLRWLKEAGQDSFKDVFYANAFTGKQILALTNASFSVRAVRLSCC